MADENIENSRETPETEAPSAPAAPDAAADVEADAQDAAPGTPPQDADGLSPRERRRRAREAKAVQSRSRQPRTPEERHAERLAQRRVKAAARRSGRQRERAKAAESASSAQATPPREHVPGKQKTRLGVVVSDAADKTITVRIDVTRRHRRYAKIVRTSSTLHAHDERNDAHTGDTVVVRESRPLSRTKHWRLVEVVERAR
jgi:small subunit ribosomal protein S17